MVSVERWAEIRRMHRVEGLSIREIARRTGLHRKTIRRALASPEPPRYRRAAKPSKLDPHREEIARLLRDHEGITNTRIRELIEEDGYRGSKTILDTYLRELRPVLCPARTYQRTIYRPGELCQFDLWEPKAEIPVGHGQTRRGFFVTAELGYSRALAGALIFSKQAPDILWGMGRCLRRLGALPKTAVWDREGAIAPQGRPDRALPRLLRAALARVADPRGPRPRVQGGARALASLHAHELRVRAPVRQPARLPAAVRRLDGARQPPPPSRHPRRRLRAPRHRASADGAAARAHAAG